MTMKLIFHFEITYNYVQIYKESALGIIGSVRPWFESWFCTTLQEEIGGVRGQALVADDLEPLFLQPPFPKTGIPDVYHHTCFAQC